MWPDTTIAVNLLAEPDLDLDSASPIANTLTSTDHHPLRVGEFEYRFTLLDLRLEHDVGGGVWEPVADRLDASLWYPAARPAFEASPTTGPRAGHGAEVRSIGLLTWDPIAWARALVPGSHPAVEDDIREGAGRLCERPETVIRDCVLFARSTPTRPVGRWFARGEAGWADAFTTVDFEDLPHSSETSPRSSRHTTFRLPPRRLSDSRSRCRRLSEHSREDCAPLNSCAPCRPGWSQHQPCRHESPGFGPSSTADWC